MRTPRSCLILGSGMGGLALGALLARAGVEVTILEAHPEWVGGWTHTHRVRGYKFTAGPRYLWNFGPGQIGRRFLEKCALTERVPMVELDRRGFDHIYVGDDAPIHVPNGWSEYEDLLKGRFPAEARGIGRFFALCRRAFRVVEVMDELGLYVDPWRSALWACFRRRPGSTAWLLLRRHLTLRQAFDGCGLGDRVRAVLYAHSGILLLPPESLSFHAYVAGTLLYHRGCYYPANDMEGFVGAVAETVAKHNGRILCNQRVVSVNAGPRGVRDVTTQSGERFSADVVVVNFDPSTFLALANHPGAARVVRVPKYPYSNSVCSLFLGVADARILERCFGRWNIWYHPGTALGPNSYDPEPLDEPGMLYVNSPTLVKGHNNDAPPGGATVTAFAPGSYRAWTAAAPAVKQVLKDKHTAMLLDLIERRFAPSLKDNVDVQFLQTPEDNERTLHAPQGNVYGRPFTSREVWAKLPYKGILPNLYFVGAYVSFPGIAPVIQGACRLYEELTADRV